MSDEEFGPPLPPGFNRTPAESDSDEEQIGPALPTSHRVKEARVAGPTLPPEYHLAKGNKSEEDNESEIEPALPPFQRRHNVIGPSLPPELSSSRDDTNRIIGPVLPSSSQTIGPTLPPQFQIKEDNYESDEDVIGPMPSMSKSDETSLAVAEFESRSRKMKEKLTGKEKEETLAPQRESWMLELPSQQMGANLGLTARTFRTRDKPENEDRSVWTDTPADRERKLEEGHDRKKRKPDMEEYMMSKKERKLASEVEKYNKSKRPESLLEMHQKKMKKKKKKEKEKPKERRPFDREVDLKVNQLDDAKKRAIIKRSQELNSRFKSGGTGTQFL